MTNHVLGCWPSFSLFNLRLITNNWLVEVVIPTLVNSRWLVGRWIVAPSQKYLSCQVEAIPRLEKPKSSWTHPPATNQNHYTNMNQTLYNPPLSTTTIMNQWRQLVVRSVLVGSPMRRFASSDLRPRAHALTCEPRSGGVTGTGRPATGSDRWLVLVQIRIG